MAFRHWSIVALELKVGIIKLMFTMYSAGGFDCVKLSNVGFWKKYVVSKVSQVITMAPEFNLAIMRGLWRVPVRLLILFNN